MDLLELDDWCKRKAQEVAMLFHNARDIDEAQKLLGEHRAFMRMHSHLHALRARGNG